LITAFGIKTYPEPSAREIKHLTRPLEILKGGKATAPEKEGGKRHVKKCNPTTRV